MARRHVTFVVALLALLLLLVGGWLGRRPIFGYLEQRNLAAARRIVGEYLADQLPFDTAAVRLSKSLDHVGWYYSLRAKNTGGGGSLTAIQLAPPGYSEEDPRITRLFRESMLLPLSPDGRARMEQSFRELDSTEAASRKRP